MPCLGHRLSIRKRSPTGQWWMVSVSRKGAEHAEQIRLPLEADARGLGGRRLPVRERRVVGESSERLEAQRVDLSAAEPEGADDMQAEQVPSMGPERGAGPAVRFEVLDDPQVPRQPIAVDGVEQQNIALGPESAVAM